MNDFSVSPVNQSFNLLQADTRGRFWLHLTSIAFNFKIKPETDGILS